MNHKIIINGKFLAQRLTGVQRVASELVSHLDDICGMKSGIELVYPQDVSNLVLKNITLKRIGSLKGNLWEQLTLPVYADNARILNLGNVAPFFSKNNYTFIHDISFHVNKEFFSKSFVYWYEFIIPKIIYRSKHVFVNSKFTKDEILKYYGDYSDKISVVYLGHEHINKKENAYYSDIINKLGVRRDGYTLVVSSRSPNKNFHRLCRALKSLKERGYNIPLVIAGGESKIFSDEGLDEYDNVHIAGYVTDSELIELYEGARIFVFPSIYEGFGLPPLEALKLGTPSVISNTSALPEVFQDSVLYCNPLDISDMSEKILELWDNAELRQKLVGKKDKLLSKYSWSKSAKIIFNKLYEDECLQL